jgi:hypothetical protein
MVIAFHGAWALGSFVVVYATFLASVCASTLLYRLSPFHPLAQYPGPLLFKVTKLAGAWAAASGNYHILLRDMHTTYGPVVRVGKSVRAVPLQAPLIRGGAGPNDLSIVDVDAIPAVLGPGGLPKGRCMYHCPQDGQYGC